MDAQQTAKVVMVDPLARNSGDLFLATGAVDEDHCGDYLTMTSSTVETDRLYSAKKQILEGMGMSADEQAFPVFADRMPLQLLAYMRFSRVQEPSELMTVSFEEDRIVSPMNEYEVLQLLMGDAREMLAEYENARRRSTSCCNSREKGLSARQLTAAKLRLGEKRLINATTTAVRRRLAPIRGFPPSRAWKIPTLTYWRFSTPSRTCQTSPSRCSTTFASGHGGITRIRFEVGAGEAGEEGVWVIARRSFRPERGVARARDESSGDKPAAEKNTSEHVFHKDALFQLDEVIRR